MEFVRLSEEVVREYVVKGLVTSDGKREITRATRSTDTTSGAVSWGWRGHELTKAGKRRANASLVTSTFFFDEEEENRLITEIVVAEAVRRTES